MKLWLLRHARVEVAPGICYGASDLAAHAQHSRESAVAAAALLPLGLPVWVSGLSRAGRLAAELCLLRPDLGPARSDLRLNEMNFGAWEGQAWDAVPKSAFDAWTEDFANHAFGGVESTQQVIDRVAAALAETRARGASEALWITHAGVIRAVKYLAIHGSERIKDVSQWPVDAPAPGGLVCLDMP
jgi:alpha-ribazole phosphatase